MEERKKRGWMSRGGIGGMEEGWRGQKMRRGEERG